MNPEREILGNMVLAWLMAGVFFLMTLAVLLQIVSLMRRRWEKFRDKEETSFDKLVLNLVSETRLASLVVLSLYPAWLWLTLPPKFSALAGKIFLTVILFQAGVWGVRVVTFFLFRHLLHRGSQSRALLSAMHLLMLMGQVVVWALVALLIMQNLGFDVTALVTGLGISGVAVALAVQSILKDLFASLSIVLDRPFDVGDGIAVGEISGVVEKIGLKTTRLRGINGEELIFSNSALLDSHLKNFRSIGEKRHVFTVPISYAVSPDDLVRAMDVVEQVVTSTENCRLDSSIIKGFGNDGVQIEVVYFGIENDMATINRNQQSIFLGILRGLHRLNIHPGFPPRVALAQG